VTYLLVLILKLLSIIKNKDFVYVLESKALVSYLKIHTVEHHINFRSIIQVIETVG